MRKVTSICSDRICLYWSFPVGDFSDSNVVTLFRSFRKGIFSFCIFLYIEYGFVVAFHFSTSLFSFFLCVILPYFWSSRTNFLYLQSILSKCLSSCSFYNLFLLRQPHLDFFIHILNCLICLCLSGFLLLFAFQFYFFPCGASPSRMKIHITANLLFLAFSILRIFIVMFHSKTRFSNVTSSIESLFSFDFFCSRGDSEDRMKRNWISN